MYSENSGVKFNDMLTIRKYILEWLAIRADNYWCILPTWLFVCAFSSVWEASRGYLGHRP